jgi:hypothetical protein
MIMEDIFLYNSGKAVMIVGWWYSGRFHDLGLYNSSDL